MQHCSSRDDRQWDGEPPQATGGTYRQVRLGHISVDSGSSQMDLQQRMADVAHSTTSREDEAWACMTPFRGTVDVQGPMHCLSRTTSPKSSSPTASQLPC